MTPPLGGVFSVAPCNRSVTTPSEHNIERWLQLKGLQLLINQELAELEPVKDYLLVNQQWDARARSLDLRLRRPAFDLYHYENKPALAKALERLRILSAQVKEQQRTFREECIAGRRQVDVDFTPSRQLRVDLLPSAQASNYSAGLRTSRCQSREHATATGTTS